MKLSKLLTIAAFIAGGFTATNALAAVPCPKWPATPTSTYPKNGHLYNCMPTPRNAAENTLQQTILNKVNAAVADYAANAADLNIRNVDIQVSYTAADSYAKNGALGTQNEPPSSATETGRSWVLPNKNPPILTNPTTSVWVFTVAQWNAISGNPKIPTTFNQDQLSGTVRHELGHQFDRIWAQKQKNGAGWNPTGTALVHNNQENNVWTQAFTRDVGKLQAPQITELEQNFPWMLNNPGTPQHSLKPNEFIAEEIIVQQGATPALTTWIRTNLPCSQWVITQMANSSTKAVPTPPEKDKCKPLTKWAPFP